MSSNAARIHSGLAIACVLLALCAVSLGAYTRLVDAGLGCPDWPGCYGHLLWPDTPDEIQEANRRFPEIPVEADKTWPEMAHRYAASLLGLGVIGLVISARASRLATGLPSAILALVIIQGLFGMWTVTLKLWPQVVLAHLLGGFATTSLLFLYAARARLAASAICVSSRLRWLALAALLMVIMQIALGGWTTANYAALACSELPTCQGSWWPASPADFARGFNFFQSVGPNYLGGQLDSDARAAIHFAHRLGAALCAGLIIALSWRLSAQAPRLALVLLVFLAAQIGLGLANIVFSLPLAVAVFHNLGGLALLTALVWIYIALRGASPHE